MWSEPVGEGANRNLEEEESLMGGRWTMARLCEGMDVVIENVAGANGDDDCCGPLMEARATVDRPSWTLSVVGR